MTENLLAPLQKFGAILAFILYCKFLEEIQWFDILGPKIA